MTRRGKESLLETHLRRRRAMESCDREIEQLRDRRAAALERATAASRQRTATPPDDGARRPPGLGGLPRWKLPFFQAAVLKALLAVHEGRVEGVRSTSHLARRLGRNPGQTMNALRSLERRGMVEFRRGQIQREAGRPGRVSTTIPSITAFGVAQLRPER